MGVASHDWIANLIAQSPQGKVLDSKFKGLADIVLAEAKTAGCSYADVRFTMSSNIPGGNANFSTQRRTRRWRRRRRRGGAAAAAVAVEAAVAAAAVALAVAAVADAAARRRHPAPTPTGRPAASASA